MPPEIGQATDVSRRIVSGLFLGLTLLGCAEDGAPEQVADAFAEAYFRRMDQEGAKAYTALGASTMLDKELADVASVRKEGYTPAVAGAQVHVQRGERSTREHRVRFPYEITIVNQGESTRKLADVELTQIDGAWKVVRLGLEHAPTPPP